MEKVAKVKLSPEEKTNKSKSTKRLMKQNWLLYIFLLPMSIYILVLNYAPLYGIQLAFKTFSSAQGIWGSPWAGFYWFELFLSSPRFGEILWNTVSLSLYSLIAGFPIPIILALILNSMTSVKFKKFCQTATYLPHFISMVIMVGMISVFFSPTSGFINTIIEFFTGETIFFMGSPEYFQDLYVWSGIWQNAGWGSIIYMAALAGVSPELHEAAIIDGATRFKRILKIDLPVIIPTMVILLVLNCGSIMNVGFEKAFLMQNNLNQEVSEVIGTYTYKLGLLQQQYSYSTAIGLFNNVINFIILITVNKVAKKLSGSSLW